jgi:hypothetical protein
MATLFESNTDKPTEFEFQGEIIMNFGDVKIVDSLPSDSIN